MYITFAYSLPECSSANEWIISGCHQTVSPGWTWGIEINPPIISLWYSKIKIISKGSSLKLCLVAEGIADCYPRFGPTMEWDTAAGQAICEAAGFQVIDLKTKKVMKYNRENL